jgi:hypothetical protein
VAFRHPIARVLALTILCRAFYQQLPCQKSGIMSFNLNTVCYKIISTIEMIENDNLRQFRETKIVKKFDQNDCSAELDGPAGGSF